MLKQKLKNDIIKITGFNRVIEHDKGLNVYTNDFTIVIMYDFCNIVNITILHDINNYEIILRYVNLKKVNVTELINKFLMVY